MNKHLKNEKYIFSFYFAVFAAASLTESVLIESFLWAGFHGFGDIAMEYTKQGRRAAGILLLSPYLVCFVVIIFFITIFHRTKQKTHKPAHSTCCVGCAAALFGTGTGIILFLLDSYTLRILWNLIYKLINLIQHSAWMNYPVP